MREASGSLMPATLEMNVVERLKADQESRGER